MSKVYFSCPKFTVLLVTNGPMIVKAAPIVKRFEGQTIGALTSWARTKFGGPILVEKLGRVTLGQCPSTSSSIQTSNPAEKQIHLIGGDQ